MLIKMIFGASLLFLIITSVLFYLYFAGISNFFIVKIDTLRGINFLGGKMDVLGILISGALLTAINIVLSAKLYYRDKFLANLLAFFTLFLSLLILISVGVIVAIN